MITKLTTTVPTEHAAVSTTYFIAHDDKNIHHVGVLQPKQCVATGQAKLELFEDQKEFRARLEELKLEVDETQFETAAEEAKLEAAEIKEGA